MKKQLPAKPLPDVAQRFLQDDDVATITKESHTFKLASFFVFIQALHKSFDTIEHSDIVKYKKTLEAKEMAAHSQRAYLSIVKNFYSWCYDKNLCKDVARKIKLPKANNRHIKQHLTMYECKNLLEVAKDNKRNYCIINLMIRQGLRTVELERIRLDDIKQMYGKHVIFIQGKGRVDKKEYIILTEKSYEVIQDYLQTCRPYAIYDEPLFISESDRSKGKLLKRDSIRHIVKGLLRKAGIDSELVTSHSLRHTTAVLLLSHGASIYEVQQVMRHSSPATTEIYLESIKEEMRFKNPTESIIDEII